MMRPGDIWGGCPYRELLISRGRGQHKHFICYMCTKTDAVCNPNYCLGPDEDMETGDDSKGETHEQEVR